MNIRQNFKQSAQIIKQNKLFSGIYIAGTAIAISMVMVIAIVWIAKTADLYPEVNRSRMMSVKGILERYNKGFSSSFVSDKFAEDFVMNTETLECVSEVSPTDEPANLRTAGEEKYKVKLLYTDRIFWNVFEFKFLSGAPYSKEDVASKLTKAVISESIAKKYFNGVEEALGKHFTLDFVDYAVCGVVKDVSAVMAASYADIWAPVTIVSGAYRYGNSGYLGNSNLYILARSRKDFKKISAEVEEKVAAFNNTAVDYKIDINGQPDSYAKGLLRQWSNESPDVNGYILKIGLIILMLLLVPAINLAGMISSKMTKRMEEMGIRKTFGATKSSILSQIINENLLLTLIGGLVGLLLSYLLLALGGDMIMSFIVPGDSVANASFTLSMLMNPWIFVIALVVCLVLNLLAAIIPAAHSLRNNIVDSLNVKK